METMRQTVAEFIRAGESLLKMKDLSEDEEQAVKDLLFELSMSFPDDDDAAD